jgi:hypothetical protein
MELLRTAWKEVGSVSTSRTLVSLGDLGSRLERFADVRVGRSKALDPDET